MPAALLASRGALADESPQEAQARRALAGQHVFTKPLCARTGKRHCLSHVATDEAGNPIRRHLGAATVTAGPQFAGYEPADLQAAYGLTAATANGGAGKTVAILDAFDWKSAEADLAEYRKRFNLPACTSASGCFKKMAADGTSTLPPEDGQGANGWGGEIMLDLEMVSAMCPACKILLLEAQSDSDNAGFNAGPATAKAQGAVALSNSYGGPEDNTVSADTTFDLGADFLITASAGDEGYVAEYPATSPFVISVGGTNLVQDTATGAWSESLWAYVNSQSGGTGSGCSAFIAQPAFQKGKLPSDINCTKRMESDISAVADPQTGVHEVITDQGAFADQVVGGTSASAPMIAALFVRFGLEKLGVGFPYEHTTAFKDVSRAAPTRPSPASTAGASAPT